LLNPVSNLINSANSHTIRQGLRTQAVARAHLFIQATVLLIVPYDTVEEV